ADATRSKEEGEGHVHRIERHPDLDVRECADDRRQTAEYRAVDVIEQLEGAGASQVPAVGPGLSRPPRPAREVCAVTPPEDDVLGAVGADPELLRVVEGERSARSTYGGDIGAPGDD